MTAAVLEPCPRTRRIERVTLPDCINDKLYFAQVREDPQVELAALDIQPTDRVVVVSSGGCTALSLLGAGAAEVHSIDINRTQNHIVELKLAAVRELARYDAIAFLGGLPMSGGHRLARYAAIRGQLSRDAHVYWDNRLTALRKGAIASGASERFIGLVCWFVKHVVHSPALVQRMLDCRSLLEQRTLYDREWDTRGWRRLFSLLLNRWSMSRAYSPEFFAQVGRRNFAEHFLALARHALTGVPIADNYFLHQMFNNRYPVEEELGVPPYLGGDGFNTIASRSGQLTLVDGSMTAYLKTLEHRSVNVFTLSNICEWLEPRAIADLFAEVERVAAPGARLVFRNFVGWTQLPQHCTRLVADPELGRALMQTDRSCVQPRAVVCRVPE